MVFRGQTTDTDRPDGIGRLELENGDFYEGRFKNGMFEGKGKLVQACGTVYDGNWKQNRREGEGMETWPDGKVYKGKFKDDKKNGYGKAKIEVLAFFRVLDRFSKKCAQLRKNLFLMDF